MATVDQFLAMGWYSDPSATYAEYQRVLACLRYYNIINHSVVTAYNVRISIQHGIERAR